MTGKVIDSGANNIPLWILPLALIIMVVFTFWYLIVAVFVIALGYKIYEKIRLKQLSEQIDPLFNQLIQANQGCLTVMDLTTKTNLNARTATWYLDQKTQEYGAVKRLFEDKGIVYYFLTANALGSIFDDSEPDADIAPNSTASLSHTDSSIESESPQVSSEIVIPTEPSTTTVIPSPSTVSVSDDNPIPSSPPPEETEAIPNTVKALNQSELAKRLEVSPTTVGKRRSDADFYLWSQSRDPDGIAWQYVEETKSYIPI